MIRRFVIVFLIAFLASCTAEPVHSDAEAARSALMSFLISLHTGDYEAAAPLYGGEYEALQVFNPQTDPNDPIALWTWACDHRLLQCLAVRSAQLQHQEKDTYVFQVEFNNPDGSLFILGPCCGANETEMPPEFQFEFTVIKNDEGHFIVMNTPPYVP